MSNLECQLPETLLDLLPMFPRGSLIVVGSRPGNGGEFFTDQWIADESFVGDTSVAVFTGADWSARRSRLGQIAAPLVVAEGCSEPSSLSSLLSALNAAADSKLVLDCIEIETRIKSLRSQAGDWIGQLVSHAKNVNGYAVVRSKLSRRFEDRGLGNCLPRQTDLPRCLRKAMDGYVLLHRPWWYRPEDFPSSRVEVLIGRRDCRKLTVGNGDISTCSHPFFTFWGNKF